MHQNKLTPARRRRSTKPTSAQKNYASENDVLSDVPFPPVFPATPLKSNSASPAPTSRSAASRPNKRSNHKNHPKNISTSPGTAKPGRRTPPHSATSRSTELSATFAGASFHASPAPSSLPIPSFLARSTSDSPSVKAPTKEPSPPASDSDSPSPCQPPVPAISHTPPVARDESPLDFFFRADKEEKEKLKRASSASATTTLGPFSPPSEPRPARNLEFSPVYYCPPRSSQSLQSRNSVLGIPQSELSGTPARSVGPAFSRPYHERIKAAQSAVRRQQHERAPRDSPLRQFPTPPPSTQDRSEALRNLLFGNGGPSQAPNSESRQLQPGTGTSSAAQVARPTVPSVEPASATAQFSGKDPSLDLHKMEDDLRRILRLDGPSAVTSQSAMTSSPPS